MYGEKRRLRTIGSYPGLSLSEARRAARRFLATADDRADASCARALSFAEARDRFLERCEGRNEPPMVLNWCVAAGFLRNSPMQRGHRSEPIYRPLRADD